MPNIKERIRALASPEAGPVAQFIKYAVSGGIATAVNVAGLFLCAWLLFDCLTPDDPFVKLLSAMGVSFDLPTLSDTERAARTMYCSIPSFIVANIVCYVLNVLFVFRSGRHGRAVEFLLFVASSGFATLLGTLVAGLLVRTMGIAFTYASAANIVTSVAVNYVARKKFVFKG